MENQQLISDAKIFFDNHWELLYDLWFAHPIVETVSRDNLQHFEKVTHIGDFRTGIEYRSPAQRVKDTIKEAKKMLVMQAIFGVEEKEPHYCFAGYLDQFGKCPTIFTRAKLTILQNNHLVTQFFPVDKFMVQSICRLDFIEGEER